ncbi:MAG: hypothetical protein IIB73_12940 [Proteobacteria bacterium]|nr:hypothetical protein [Pseudomonadota bacterium]
MLFGPAMMFSKNHRLIRVRNIIKHAKANKVQLTLSNKGNHSTDESLLMTIRDDGMGFDITQTQTGLGLSGIRERVVALNGEFEIQTENGQGCEDNHYSAVKKRGLWALNLKP